MEFNKLLDSLAFKYKDNVLAKFFVRPFYRMKVKHAENIRRKLFHLNAEELLKKIKMALDDNNVFFWLEFGTLLGVYRENNFIEHDLDLDIGVFFEDTYKINGILKDYGFVKIKEYKVGDDGCLGFEETYKYKGVTVDVFYFHKNEDMMYCITFSAFENEYVDNLSLFQVKQISVPFNGFSKIEFKGTWFNIPQKTEEHLAAHYGVNFMIPNAKFDYKKEATNIHWFSREERIACYNNKDF